MEAVENYVIWHEAKYGRAPRDMLLFDLQSEAIKEVTVTSLTRERSKGSFESVTPPRRVDRNQLIHWIMTLEWA